MTHSLLDLNDALESMIERAGMGKWRCTMCGLENDKYKVKRHAEVHLDMTHVCMVCDKVFNTRNTLATHYSKQHAGEVSTPWTMK